MLRRKLLRKHQGTICCYPASPGTVFSVELPQLLDEPIIVPTM